MSRPRLAPQNLRRCAAFVLFGCVNALAGCGDDGDEPTPATVTTAEPSTTTTEAATGATVEQYASAVAESVEDLGALDAVADCVTAYPDCGTGFLEMTTASFEAQLLSMRLRGLDPPPAEIVELVSRTATAADDYRAAVESFRAADCPSSGDAGCRSLLADASDAAGALAGAVDAWGPYL